MSFLIDENLSFRLKKLLEPRFPGCRHVADCGLSTADDAIIHAFAKAEGLALLSKDDDFRLLVERAGPPPKLVFVRLGNVTTGAIAAEILAREAEIRAFLATAQLGVLQIAV